MSDEIESKTLNGWVKLFHPRGPQVTLPVPAHDYTTAFSAVSAALDAGFLVTAPGLEQGEEKDMVAYVVKGESEGRDGLTPFVLLYSENDAFKWSFLKVYLNTTADREAFEFASGMKLMTIPVYIGQDKPERGKNRNADKFIVPTPKNFGVVFKTNPKWNQEGSDAAKAKGEAYTVPKRVFVRWENQIAKDAGQQTIEPDEAEEVYLQFSRHKAVNGHITDSDQSKFINLLSQICNVEITHPRQIPRNKLRAVMDRIKTLTPNPGSVAAQERLVNQ